MMQRSIAKRLKVLAWIIREIVSVGLWTLIIIKIFAYDIEDVIIRFFPSTTPIFRLRFFIPVAVAIFLILLSRKGFRRTVLFIAFYPFVLFGWRVPKLLWRRLAVALIFLPVIIAFTSTIKRKIIIDVVAIYSAVTIVAASEKFLIGAAMVMLLAFLIAHYVDRFRFAYGGSKILTDAVGRVAYGQQKEFDDFRNTEMKAANSLDRESEVYRMKHTQNLQSMFTKNLIFTALHRRLDRATRISDLSLLAMFVFTFLLTTMVFGFEYFGLRKIEPTSFTGTGRDSFLAYVLFSFTVLVRSTFASVVPASNYARQLIMVEVITGFVLLIILFWVIFASTRQRHRDNVNSVVIEISKLGPAVGTFIQEEFQLTLLEAEAQIITENPEFRSTIRFLGGEVHFPEPEGEKSKNPMK